MTSMLAFPLASPLGGNLVSGLFAEALGKDMWRLEWVPISVAWDSGYMIAVDGKHALTVRGIESITIQGEPDANPVVEIVQIPADLADPGYFIPGYFSTTPDNKIKITWDAPASVIDVERYRVYWDAGAGTVVFDDVHNIGEVLEDGSGSYELFTDELAVDTFKFVIRTVDDAGNESTNTTANSQVLSKYPGLVTAEAIVYDNGTDKVTITWTDPADIGSGDVRIYTNNGSLTNLFPDYSTPLATIAAGVQTFTSAALADGIHVFGLRVFDGTNEEPNTSVILTVRVEGLSEVSGSPQKPELQALNSDGGKVKLIAIVDANSEVTDLARKVKFFTNDGAGGAVDYNTPLGGDFVNLNMRGLRFRAFFETSAFAETARKFGVEAFTDAGVASVRADEVTITPDATSPPQPLNVTTATGRD